MKFVMQTKLHDPEKGIRGNCLAACVASLLTLRIDQVPAFEDLPDDVWQDELLDCFAKRGIDVEMTRSVPRDYAIANGISPRGVGHSVIVRNGEFVHDPHPSGNYLESIDYYWGFTCEDIELARPALRKSNTFSNTFDDFENIVVSTLNYYQPATQLRQTVDIRDLPGSHPRIDENFESEFFQVWLRREFSLQP